ncbi:MAG: C39 family peptidase [Gemmataceae bacterium]
MVEARLEVEIQPQPDDFTCGPTCLDSIYRYYGDPLPLKQVIAEVPQLEGGGTLAVYLACHALKRGYEAVTYTYNLNIFDPTWFELDVPRLEERLLAQKACKPSPKLHHATDAYMEYLQLGGELRFQDLTTSLIRGYLNRGTPILTGLSATYLYRQAREYGPNSDHDDIRGEPAGHFVVLCGYDKPNRQVLVADPLRSNPVARTNMYWVNIDRVIAAILLGIVTYDGNLLIIRPGKGQKHIHVNPHRR